MSAKTHKIVFVCTGNTCRSPMAEILLKTQLEGLGWKGIAVTSAGIAAKRGAPMNPKSMQVLTENGLIVGEFSSKKLTDRLLRDAYAIVCMTESQREYLMDARWSALKKKGEEAMENNVFSFAELAGYEILDPYGRDLDCYRYVFGLLKGGMYALTEKLALQSIARKPSKRGRPKKTANKE